MELDGWLPVYGQIEEDFGYSREREREAGLRLVELLVANDLYDAGPVLDRLDLLIRGSTVVVVGGAVGELDDDHTRIIREAGAVISADGATTGLRAQELVPDIIVTDLDGPVEDQLRAGAAGAVLVVHAHGDNVPALQRWVPEMRPPILGTTQIDPPEGLFNFGGFTDGDRAVMMAEELGAEVIVLIGFDFSAPGVHSYHTDDDLKARKLAWAQRLIAMVDTEIRFL